MKIRIFFISLILLLISVNCYAVEISAKSAILYEPVTERILFEKNSEIRMPMASTTKIATALTVLENCNLNDVVTVSEFAAKTEGSSIWLEEGEHISVEDLLYGLLLSSGNDAAVALAEHISGDTNEFSKLMNKTFKELKNTNFKNPSGLDEENHYTSAYDLAKITQKAMKNETFCKITSTKTKNISRENYTYKRTLNNHNKLLKICEGCIGGKTGFTKKDGRCLVSVCKRNGITLICVTLNDPNDWNDHINLFEYGYSKLYNKEFFVTEKFVNGYKIKGKYRLNLPVSDNDKCFAKLILPQKKHNGYLKIFINDNEFRLPLVSEQISFETKDKTYIEYLKKYIEMCII